ncbi:phosphoribosyltransferase [Pseudarthrobacter sp. J1763]|uniref:phosphoribosyltransferase n=1 Tax=Pseudarthrobacter sp. J1763 TaxID=3420445 RepID=UPI003D2D8B96
MSYRFADRAEAGRRLAMALPQLREQQDTVVLGLARGGVAVAAATARELYLPFGALLVRKLGIPSHPETAYGALAHSQGRIVRILDRRITRGMLSREVTTTQLAEIEQTERAALERQVLLYPVTPPVKGKTVLIIDDGLATGATMRAGIEAVKDLGASRVLLAVPVASVEASRALQRVSEGLVALQTPGKFHAVGSYYRDFPQLSDADCIQLFTPRPN